MSSSLGRKALQQGAACLRLASKNVFSLTHASNKYKFLLNGLRKLWH